MTTSPLRRIWFRLVGHHRPPRRAADVRLLDDDPEIAALSSDENEGDAMDYACQCEDDASVADSGIPASPTNVLSSTVGKPPLGTVEPPSLGVSRRGTQ